MAKAGRQPKAEFGPANRIVAAVLAVVWLAAGSAAIVLAVAGRYWPGLVLGPLAIGYGLLWVRVAYLGRRVRWRGPPRQFHSSMKR